METIAKKLVVGMSKRTVWQENVKALLEKIVCVTKLKLNDKQQKYLATLPEHLTALIYAGTLKRMLMKFGGETCQVEFVYYPDEEEHDDLDMSLLEVANWNVDRLQVQVDVEDKGYAAALVEALAEGFFSEHLSVELVDELDNGEASSVDEEETKPAIENIGGQSSKTENKDEITKPTTEDQNSEAENEEECKPATNGEDIKDNEADKKGGKTDG